jgi:hypothetical protein
MINPANAPVGAAEAFGRKAAAAGPSRPAGAAPRIKQPGPGGEAKWGNVRHRPVRLAKKTTCGDDPSCTHLVRVYKILSRRKSLPMK